MKIAALGLASLLAIGGSFSFAVASASAATPNSLAASLKGRILLQVQARGEAWYVNPNDSKRYYLGTPDDAVKVMRRLGLGVSNRDFDGFHGKAPARLAGRILLKVEDLGKAYYVNPKDLSLTYLSPASALTIMRTLGLGISNSDLQKLVLGDTGSAAPGLTTSIGSGPDTDADGISDQAEITYGTDQYRADTDRDGYSDGQEVGGGYNPLGVGPIARSQSTLHASWHRYTSPAGYSIDFPDQFAPRVVVPSQSTGSSAILANYNSQALSPAVSDRVRISVERSTDYHTIEEIRAPYQNPIFRSAFPELGELTDVNLGETVRLSVYNNGIGGEYGIIYYGCRPQPAECFMLGSSDPGFTQNRTLVEQIVSSLTFN